MTTILAEWASELRQITKIRPSDSSGGKTFQRRCKLGMVERIRRLFGKNRLISIIYVSWVPLGPGGVLAQEAGLGRMRHGWGAPR